MSTASSLDLWPLTAQGGRRWAAGPGKGGYAGLPGGGSGITQGLPHASSQMEEGGRGVREAWRCSALKMDEWATRQRLWADSSQSLQKWTCRPHSPDLGGCEPRLLEGNTCALQQPRETETVKTPTNPCPSEALTLLRVDGGGGSFRGAALKIKLLLRGHAFVPTTGPAGATDLLFHATQSLCV